MNDFNPGDQICTGTQPVHHVYAFLRLAIEILKGMGSDISTGVSQTKF